MLSRKTSYITITLLCVSLFVPIIPSGGTNMNLPSHGTNNMLPRSDNAFDDAVNYDRSSNSDDTRLDDFDVDPSIELKDGVAPRATKIRYQKINPWLIKYYNINPHAKFVYKQDWHSLNEKHCEK